MRDDSTQSIASRVPEEAPGDFVGVGTNSLPPRAASRDSIIEPHAHAGNTALLLGAIGIVFGDIGTSPLYTFQECIGPRGVTATLPNVLGVLSLIFWSLILVVTVKYMTFLMRADNQGEGGILALLALAPERARQRSATRVPWIAALVIAGAALMFGDGIITPAISVLSAMEGLDVATTSMHSYIVPLTVLILVGLFAIQRHGTGGIGKLFGPIMVVWFVTIGTLGMVHVIRNPVVLQAVLPTHAVSFFLHNGRRGFVLLGSVVLAVTGGEALYADMGHFGRSPIRRAWTGLILPSLVLCYFGQGALILRDPRSIANPFFGMVPSGAATMALVAIAAPATVIASQALISGVFSLTQQAIRLGYFPRVEVRHTSPDAEGQIYVPALNWGLALACIALVVIFQKSERLAAAFGLAVSGTMMITSVVYYVVTRDAWHWPQRKSLAVLILFLSFDIPFLLANLLKFFDGGYLPLLVGAGIFAVMLNWKIGRAVLADYYLQNTPALDTFLAEMPKRLFARRPGTGVFLASSTERTPPPLFRHVQRLGVLEQRVVLFTVTTEHVPFIDPETRVAISSMAPEVYWVVARYGFLERPDVPRAMAQAVGAANLDIDPRTVTYYLGRETFVAGPGGRLGRMSEALFAFLSRNAYSAPLYFEIPPDQVVELGSQIDL